MSAERYEPYAFDPEDTTYRLSDGSEHESQAAAEAYKAVKYPDDAHADIAHDANLNKLMLSGTAATIGLAGLFFVVKRRLNKDQ
ncbi:MAG: hypothetical protein V4678_03660 [Patescibacteria group bacterium]